MSLSITGYAFIGLPSSVTTRCSSITPGEIILKDVSAREYVLSILEKTYGHPPGEFDKDLVEVELYLGEGSVLQRTGGLHSGILHIGPLILFKHDSTTGMVLPIGGKVDRVAADNVEVPHIITSGRVLMECHIKLLVPVRLLESPALRDCWKASFQLCRPSGEIIPVDRVHTDQKAWKPPTRSIPREMPAVPKLESYFLGQEPGAEAAAREKELADYQKWIDYQTAIIMDHQFELDSMRQRYIKEGI